MKNRGFAAPFILMLVALAVAGYFAYQNTQARRQTIPSTSQPSVEYCKANFRVEPDTGELSASEFYSMECGYKQTESECYTQDVYNTASRDFSKPDGIPDCIWVKTQFCGGIQGLACPKGYECKLDGNYPDAGGTCVKDEKPTSSSGEFKFAGEISAVDNSCNRDGVCKVKVNGVWIITDLGGDPNPEMEAQRGPKGYILLENGERIRFIPESYINKFVAVYAKAIDETNATLYGNPNYIIKMLGPK